MPNVAELIKEHVTLTVDCVDRVYLNGYVPALYSSGGVVSLLRRRGATIPSPALFRQITEAFKDELRGWCDGQDIPWIEFKRVKRKGEGVVSFDFVWTTVCVNHYYVYFIDEAWGPGFLKSCGYAPYTLKLCLNGHAWAKRQLTQEGIAFEALDNGFR